MSSRDDHRNDTQPTDHARRRFLQGLGTVTVAAGGASTARAAWGGVSVQVMSTP